jgi:hypothetical protein
MTKLLTAVALAATLLSSAAYAEKYTPEERAVVLATIGIHAKFCSTPQSAGVLKTFAVTLKGPKIPSAVTQEAIERILGQMKDAGVGPWCRQVTAMFQVATE